MLTELESLELCMYNLGINKIWFISISLFWLDFKKTKIAYSGVRYEIINLCLLGELRCFRRFWVTKQSNKRKTGVSSFDLQNEHYGLVIFSKRKHILCRYKTLLIILYWNILVKVWTVIFQGINHISFQS